MGIFSRFKKTEIFNLKKSDFKTEKDEYEAEVTFMSEEFAKSIAEFKKKEGIPEIKNGTNKITSVTSYTDISILRNKVRIQYDPTEIVIDENDFIKQINQKLNWISRNENEINDGIVKYLLSLKNENWLEENEVKLSEKKFLSKIELISILFFDDSSYELNYDDGELFWNHQIIVSFDKDNILIKADISG